jgi:hypothetical protein
VRLASVRSVLGGRSARPAWLHAPPPAGPLKRRADADQALMPIAGCLSRFKQLQAACTLGSGLSATQVDRAVRWQTNPGLLQPRRAVHFGMVDRPPTRIPWVQLGAELPTALLAGRVLSGRAGAHPARDEPRHDAGNGGDQRQQDLNQGGIGFPEERHEDRADQAQRGTDENKPERADDQ